MSLLAKVLLWGAGLVDAGLVAAVFLLPPPRGMNELGALLVMMAAEALRWVLVGAALTECVVAGGFDWLRLASRGRRWGVVAGGHVVLGGLSAASLFAFVEPGSIQGLPGGLGGVLNQVAQIGFTLPATMVIVFLAVVGRPAPGVAGPARGVLAGVGAGALAGVVVAGAMYAQDVMDQRGRVVADRLVEERRAEEMRAEFGTLTDADPLLRWDEFVGGNVPEDVAAEALRRLSVRPGLERDLAEALGCDCRNPLWTAELLWLFTRIPFAPSAEMADPVRRGMAALTANLAEQARQARGDERDIYVDRYLGRDLEVVPAAALRLARSGKVDLRPEVTEMRRAVLEVFPRSEAARWFPVTADRAVAEIGGVLEGR